jgi:hypothetical protein
MFSTVFAYHTVQRFSSWAPRYSKKKKGKKLFSWLKRVSLETFEEQSVSCSEKKKFENHRYSCRIHTRIMQYVKLIILCWHRVIIHTSAVNRNICSRQTCTGTSPARTRLFTIRFPGTRATRNNIIMNLFFRALDERNNKGTEF